MKPNTEWLPQRDVLDAPAALVRNLALHQALPISYMRIDNTAAAVLQEDGSVSLATFMKVFEQLKLDYRAFPCPVDRLPDVPNPSIILIEEDPGNIEFVLYFPILNRILNTRKGWSIFKPNHFGGVCLSILTVPEPETDYEEIQKDYRAAWERLPGRDKVRSLQGFLSVKECEYIIGLAGQHFKRSELLLGNTRIVDSARTSWSAELHAYNSDPTIVEIRQRAAALIGLPESHFEGFQCVSYEPGQEIEGHFDTFDDRSEGGRQIIAAGGQRKYTLLVYLNDDYIGGETWFPTINFKTEPKTGGLVIFDNIDDNGKRIGSSWHAGLPVFEGRKYALNIWVRTKPFISHKENPSL